MNRAVRDFAIVFIAMAFMMFFVLHARSGEQTWFYDAQGGLSAIAGRVNLAIGTAPAIAGLGNPVLADQIINIDLRGVADRSGRSTRRRLRGQARHRCGCFGLRRRAGRRRFDRGLRGRAGFLG
jgi:hypothetical protein